MTKVGLLLCSLCVSSMENNEPIYMDSGWICNVVSPFNVEDSYEVYVLNVDDDFNS